MKVKFLLQIVEPLTKSWPSLYVYLETKGLRVTVMKLNKYSWCRGKKMQSKDFILAVWPKFFQESSMEETRITPTNGTSRITCVNITCIHKSNL